jgi:hypothetical protein
VQGRYVAVYPSEAGPICGAELERPTLDELVEIAQPPAWWIWFNVRRELDDEPIPLPGLTSALLSGVKPIEIEEMERRRALFE